MKTYFISRHSGARHWAARQNIDATFLEHLEVASIEPGDTVIGNLPIPIAASVCNIGARFFHLSLEIPVGMRGEEFNADQMDTYNAKLQEFYVKAL